LIEDRTTLYRHLIDLTCRKAAKAEDAKDSSADEHKVYGGELRDLLHRTAAAITGYGQENIPLNELALRLGLKPSQLDDRVAQQTKEHKLSSLLISFYFKGGHQSLGCEFGHKSFREYLFAEGIVEALKDYGRKQRRTPPERAHYWQDFDPNDAGDFRYEFSRNLSELLAPQWLTPEVQRHLQRLIEWEIVRAVEMNKGEAVTPEPAERVGMPTEALGWQSWSQVRTGLANLWEWWGEGVHLRPQLVKDRRGRDENLEPAYVNEMIEYAAWRDPNTRGPDYVRTTTVDARLGDGLCLLTALVHAFMADNEQEPNLSQTTQPRKYQAIQERDVGERLLFKPSGDGDAYFKNYTSRINSAGWRPGTDFPCSTFLASVVFTGAILESIIFYRTILSGADFTEAYLFGADFEKANLFGATLSHTNLINARLIGANLSGATLREAYLGRANLSNANLSGTDLSDADLEDADFRAANLSGADFSNARFGNTNLSYADLDETILTADQIQGAVIKTVRVFGRRLDKKALLQMMREQEEKQKPEA
jgi:uncharacterized protein YjbI with pentapeptide repeats